MKSRVTFTIDTEVIEALRETSKLTMIPQARIVERAIEKELKWMNTPGTQLIDANTVPWTLDEDKPKE